jgi:hypothetical protein
MCDEGMAVSRSLGGGAIDVQRAMRAIQRTVRAAAERSKDPKDRPTLHAADGIHLSDLGQLAMAFAILKGLGAPADVSSATLDARGPALVEARGCRIANLAGGPSKLEFDRLDDGLPINFGIFGALQFRYVPVPDELDRYMLTVKGLPPGRYEVTADGRSLGAFAAEALSAGVNIASATADGWEPGGPWDAQAALLIRLTDARNDIAAARLLLGHYLHDQPNGDAIREQSDEVNVRLETLQRTLARPTTYHFVVQPATTKRPRP